MHRLSLLPKKIKPIMRVDNSRQVFAAGIETTPKYHVSRFGDMERQIHLLHCDLVQVLYSRHFQILRGNANREPPDALVLCPPTGNC